MTRRRPWPDGLPRLMGLVLSLVMLLAGHPDGAIAAFQDPSGGYDVAVVEHLRVKVPAEGRVGLKRAVMAPFSALPSWR